MSTVRMSLAVQMPLYRVSIYRAWMQRIILSEMAGRTKIMYILEANLNRLPSELFSSGVSAYLLNTPFFHCPSTMYHITHFYFLHSMYLNLSFSYSLVSFFVCLFVLYNVRTMRERPYLHNSFSPWNLSMS